MQPDEFIDWLHTIERVFDFKDVSDDRKVKLAALKLRKYAGLWWENLKRQRVREGRRPIHNLKQNDLSVEAYTAEFDYLMIKCDVVEPQEQTIARFLGGLRTEIGHMVQLQPYWTYSDVCKLAMRVERQIKETQGSGFRPLSKEGSFNQGSSSTSRPSKNVKPFTPRSLNKGESSKQQGPPNTSSRKCFKCQGYGHIAADCPNRKIISLVEEEIEEGSNEDEVVHADEGELLVCLSLNVQLLQEDDWLRHNIFHTRCTCRGKVCDVIIDGGSFENVISSDMVDKLQLKTKDHPHPYRLTWLEKKKEIKVSKRYLVQFSISGKYKDEVMCDVVPMNACHLLLGRPWQYD
ncbi:Zinc finger CCHC-type protein [Dioscorea alata]|uniref:Zinc finger CCHC-type protein n=1 Tax=Dioscorea alata TaxID=55571 RepID=A0ACB7W5S5_DIOAL|nr:Zinc finger CCHC-type protein [Dioscorea alata]